MTEGLRLPGFPMSPEPNAEERIKMNDQQQGSPQAVIDRIEVQFLRPSDLIPPERETYRQLHPHEPQEKLAIAHHHLTITFCASKGHNAFVLGQ